MVCLWALWVQGTPTQPLFFSEQFDDSSSKQQGWHEDPVFVREGQCLRAVDNTGPRTRKALTLEGSQGRTCKAGGREESESL